MRVALIHDWLTGMRGGEKCLEIFCEEFPDAPVYTLFHLPGSVSETIERHTIHTSFLQRFPSIEKRYRNYLPWFPRAIESFDLSGYDLIISSSHCVAKSVVCPESAVHLCYIFTPMRYIWDMVDIYFSGPKRVIRPLVQPLIKKLRRWDKKSAQRVTQFVAISEFVAERVTRTYDCPARVVYPPVDTSGFPLSSELGEHYLMVAADAAYKRADLACEAFGKLGIPLVIVGKRQDRNPLARTAPANVDFRGFVEDEELQRLYRTARGFLLPCAEEFGIAAVEAMACGKPVIALGAGAALETVRGADCENPTGVHFFPEAVDPLVEAVQYLEANRERYIPERIREHALQFGEQRFRDEMLAEIEQLKSRPTA